MILYIMDTLPIALRFCNGSRWSFATKTCCASLGHLQCVNQILLVGVPNRRGVFKDGVSGFCVKHPFRFLWVKAQTPLALTAIDWTCVPQWRFSVIPVSDFTIVHFCLFVLYSVNTAHRTVCNGICALHILLLLLLLFLSDQPFGGFKKP